MTNTFSFLCFDAVEKGPLWCEMVLQTVMRVNMTKKSCMYDSTWLIGSHVWCRLEEFIWIGSGNVRNVLYLLQEIHFWCQWSLTPRTIKQNGQFRLEATQETLPQHSDIKSKVDQTGRLLCSFSLCNKFFRHLISRHQKKEEYIIQLPDDAY